MGRKVMAFHKDEQGAEMLEYVLVVAAIALPLLAVVIYYWKDLATWVKGLWEDTKTKSDPNDVIG